jgi:4-hydroxy-tetrahydrodipicolinate synthase
MPFFKLTEGMFLLGTYECPSPYKRILSEEVLSHMLPSGRLIYHKDTTEDIDHIARKLAISKGSPLGLYNAHMGSAVASLRMGGAGLSPIAGNYYPEIISWVCQHATDPSKKEDVDWLQIQLAKLEPIITKNYQLSARYFLNQSGMSLELLSRNSKGKLSGNEMKILDNAVKEVNSWKERLGLPLV